ncbi:MAG: hypothetical protein GY861_14735 [bacterium]|nr:hypothetical protein [bacterium]
MELPLASSSQEVRAGEVSSERLVNWYAEQGGKSRFSIKPTPGLDSFSSLTPALGDGIRGMHSLGFTSGGNQQMFAVAGNSLYGFTEAGVSSLMGTLSNTNDTIFFADNGAPTATAGDKMIYNISDVNDASLIGGEIMTLSTGTIAGIVDYPGGAPVWMDGYMVAPEPETNRVYVSAINAPQTWNGEFLPAQASPGEVVRVLRNARDLWIMKVDGTEVWQNVGNADFPFAPIQGAESDIGTITADSVSQTHDHIFWVSQSQEGKGMVWMNQGYVPQRISTSAVEVAMAEMTSISDVKTFCYQNEGHIFFVMNFSTDEQTWVYDMTTGLWHERSYHNKDAIAGNNTAERWRPEYQAVMNGVTYVGDYDLNELYELSETAYLDDTASIIRICETPNVHAERKRVFFPDIELDMERGVGLTSGQGLDPQIMMQISDDGGKTWGIERWKSAGAAGDYDIRVKWDMLGQSRSRSFRFMTSDPVNFTLIALYSKRMRVGNE